MMRARCSKHYLELCDHFLRLGVPAVDRLVLRCAVDERARRMKACPRLAQLVVDRPVVRAKLVRGTDGEEDESRAVGRGKKELAVRGEDEVEHVEAHMVVSCSRHGRTEVEKLACSLLELLERCL